MSYLDELLAGYRQGLEDEPQQPVSALAETLALAHDPGRRGRLLGLLAQVIARADGRSDATGART